MQKKLLKPDEPEKAEEHAGTRATEESLRRVSFAAATAAPPAQALRRGAAEGALGALAAPDALDVRGDAARVRAKRGGLRPERSRQGNLIHFAYAWSRNRVIGLNSKQRNTSKKMKNNETSASIFKTKYY